MKSKTTDFLKNIGYSFLSFALPTIVLQLIIQPAIANKIGAELNGQYLTLMSFNFFLIGITASVLNTVRLLQNGKYETYRYKGDFNGIYLFYVIFLLLTMPIAMLYYTKKIVFIDLVLYLAIGQLYLYHDYIFVQYRLKLEYNKILISNILMVLGYVVGIFVFFHFLKWQLVFISAYIFSFVYDYSQTDFIREPVCKTPLFNDTIKLLVILTISSILGSALTYFDKLLLYPMLGGSSVSIYNTASLIGKVLLLISAPMSSVFLSYLVQEDTIINRFRLKHYLSLVIFLILVYAICVIAGFPLTDYLYPNWSKESQKLIPITVAASLFFLLSNCINTVLIRFFKTYLQIILQGIHLAFYLILSLVGLKLYGLLGFCIGVATSNFIRLFLVIITLRLKPKKYLIIEEGIQNE